MDLTPGFWSGRRVLVTGHTGFKGGWLSIWLQLLGADVAGIALEPSTHPSLFEVGRVAAGLRSEIINIDRIEPARRFIAEVEPEIVFHLAAQPLVRVSYEQPVATMTTNVLGTVNLLQAVREVGSAAAVVVITSDKCYDTQEKPGPYDETAPLGGHDPYSSSKACAELVTAAFRRSFFEREGVQLATARSGNVVGGGDWSRDRLVPDFVRSVTAGEKAPIRNPNAVRPWMHVLDPLFGYLILAERLRLEGKKFAGPWNFGPDASAQATVADVVEHLSVLWGEDAGWTRVYEEEAPHETAVLTLDASKAKRDLGWSPRWNLVEALHRTVAWFRGYRDGVDMRRLTEDQILDYRANAPAEPAARETDESVENAGGRS